MAQRAGAGRAAAAAALRRASPCVRLTPPPCLPPAHPAHPQNAFAASSLGSRAAAALQQARPRTSAAAGISADVQNGNVDKAWRMLSRKCREEGFLEAAQERAHYVKPSARRKQAASAAAKRFRKQEFKCGRWGCGLLWAVGVWAGGLRVASPSDLSCPRAAHPRSEMLQWIMRRRAGGF